MMRFILGAVTLLIAALLSFGAVAGAVAGFWPGAPVVSPFFLFVPAIFFFLVTVYLWTKAIRSTEDDDLFSGQRGLLISAMIVTTLVIAGTMLFFSMDIDSWRGFMDASRH